MNTQHLQYVVEIERMRSISQAAENLFIGQPNLSRILHDINQREAAHAPPPTERAKLDWYPLPLSLALFILALGQWVELRGGGRR